MADYQNMELSEVMRRARLKDKDAYYEMVWRMTPDIQRDPVESCAWQDYWMEKAADAGNVTAKGRYARSLINRIMNKEDRLKAIDYFQSLVDDFDSGKLTGEQTEDGAIAKIWLGVMLCEGYHTRRDAIAGAKLIQEADAFFDGFEGFGYGVMNKLGGIYAEGLAQPGEDPSVSDLRISIKYLKIAIDRFNPRNDDPNNRGILQLTKKLCDLQQKRIEDAMRYRRDYVHDMPDEYKRERREKMMLLSDASIQRLNADRAAAARLRQRLAKEGW